MAQQPEHTYKNKICLENKAKIIHLFILFKGEERKFNHTCVYTSKYASFVLTLYMMMMISNVSRKDLCATYQEKIMYSWLVCFHLFVYL